MTFLLSRSFKPFYIVTLYCDDSEPDKSAVSENLYMKHLLKRYYFSVSNPASIITQKSEFITFFSTF